MNSKLYETLFAKMDRLGAIRKDVQLGCLVKHFYNGKIGTVIGHKEDAFAFDVYIAYDDGDDIDSPDISDIRKYIIGHPPILSDCLQAICTVVRKNKFLSYGLSTVDFVHSFNLSKPNLRDQSDELGEKLLELLS